MADKKQIDGLPVSGYRPQSDRNVALVNRNKEAEERVLRILDELATLDEVDKRWLSIGRTAIEQGFMAVNRSVFRPGRFVPAPLAQTTPAVETGWVLEDVDSPASAPLYFCAKGPGEPGYSPNHMDALRFARRVDAVAYATMVSPDWESLVRIAEHSWG